MRIGGTGEKFKAMNSVLVMLLRLRQAAVHLSLTKKVLIYSLLRDLHILLSNGLSRSQLHW